MKLSNFQRLDPTFQSRENKGLVNGAQRDVEIWDEFSGDRALLCANCHRMVHAKRPWLSLAELKALIADRDAAARTGGARVAAGQLAPSG